MEELALVLDDILRERYCMVLHHDHLKYSLGPLCLFQEYLAHLTGLVLSLGLQPVPQTILKIYLEICRDLLDQRF